MDLALIDIVGRLLFATAAGMIIGINRDMQNKPTGMRTLGLVSLGAALVTLATIDFGRIEHNADALSRVVQGVIQGVLTGVGFIGAGVILRDRRGMTVHGLTTAATVWVTAALGIACALAAWPIVIVGTAATVLLLMLGGVVERFIPNRGDDPPRAGD
jgi:putative Mg2+ transporter-C (MgtC) family protein